MLSRGVVIALVAAIAALAVSLYFAIYYLQGSGIVEVKIGTLRGGVSTLDVIVYKRLDEKYGLKVEPVYFTATLDLANALIHGDVDVAIIPVEFVAKLRQMGHDVVVLVVDFYQNQAIVVRQDLNIESLEDLRGLRIGVFKPTGTYAMFRAYVVGVFKVMEPEELDSMTINLPPPQLVQAFERGDVDAVVVWEPLVSKLVMDYEGKIAFSFRDLWSMWLGNTSLRPVMVVYAALREWVENNRDIVEKLLTARSEAARIWNNDGRTALKILMEEYGLSREAAEFCWKRLRMEEALRLTRDMVEGAMMVWRLAKLGGYIEVEPEEIASGAFLAGG